MLTVRPTEEAVITLPRNICKMLGVYERENVEVEVKGKMLWIYKVNYDTKDVENLERFKRAKGSWKGVNVNLIYKELYESWKKWQPKEFV
ncbi:MAG: hypothetical protein AAB296_01815 [Candidatus Desantisbacteria bacterium]